MPKEPLDNREVIESSDDFESMYESHAPAIYRFLFWRTRNTALSEDLTSSVFEKAWRSRSSFRGGSTKAWLHRIARNTLTDYWRKKTELLVDDPELLQQDLSDNNIDDEALDQEATLKKLKLALDRLPDQMNQIVRLRFIEGLSCKQVATRLDISESNVRVIQYRALQKLRTYMK